MKNRKIIFVGAGVGSVDLLTIKGLCAIQSADVLLIDDLLGDDFELIFPITAIVVRVGKRCGKNSVSQEEIHKQLISYANQGLNVVRLKGGDPFIFGRGMEEVIAMSEEGIEVEIVPGVSSMNGVTTSNYIPLTHRKMSRGFWVTTATHCNDEFTSDLNLAAQSSSTIVIYMGLRQLPNIVNIVKQYRTHNTPIAIIQNGGTKKENIVISTLETINNSEQNIQPDEATLILIGEVVGLREKVLELIQQTSMNVYDIE